MAKGDKPVFADRFENVSVSVWENTKVSGDGTYKTITIDVGRVKKESKDKTKEERTPEDYVHNKVVIGFRQLQGLKDLLAKVN